MRKTLNEVYMTLYVKARPRRRGSTAPWRRPVPRGRHVGPAFRRGSEGRVSALHIAARSHERVVAQHGPGRDDRQRRDEAAAANRRVGAGHRRQPAGEALLDGVMGVEVRPRTDLRVVADAQGALRPVEDGERADPAVRADDDVAQDQALVVDRGARTEAEFGGQLPPIVQQRPDSGFRRAPETKCRMPGQSAAAPGAGPHTPEWGWGCPGCRCRCSRARQ